MPEDFAFSVRCHQDIGVVNFLVNWLIASFREGSNRWLAVGFLVERRCQACWR